MAENAAAALDQASQAFEAIPGVLKLINARLSNVEAENNALRASLKESTSLTANLRRELEDLKRQANAFQREHAHATRQECNSTTITHKVKEINQILDQDRNNARAEFDRIESLSEENFKEIALLQFKIKSLSKSQKPHSPSSSSQDATGLGRDSDASMVEGKSTPVPSIPRHLREDLPRASAPPTLTKSSAPTKSSKSFTSTSPRRASFSGGFSHTRNPPSQGLASDPVPIVRAQCEGLGTAPLKPRALDLADTTIKPLPSRQEKTLDRDQSWLSIHPWLDQRAPAPGPGGGTSKRDRELFTAMWQYYGSPGSLFNYTRRCLNNGLTGYEYPTTEQKSRQQSSKTRVSEVGAKVPQPKKSTNMDKTTAVAGDDETVISQGIVSPTQTAFAEPPDPATATSVPGLFVSPYPPQGTSKQSTNKRRISPEAQNEWRTPKIARGSGSVLDVSPWKFRGLAPRSPKSTVEQAKQRVIDDPSQPLHMPNLAEQAQSRSEEPWRLVKPQSQGTSGTKSIPNPFTVQDGQTKRDNTSEIEALGFTFRESKAVEGCGEGVAADAMDTSKQ